MPAFRGYPIGLLVKTEYQAIIFSNPALVMASQGSGDVAIVRGW